MAASTFGMAVYQWQFADSLVCIEPLEWQSASGRLSLMENVEIPSSDVHHLCVMRIAKIC